MMQQCLSSSSRSQNQLQERLSYAGNDTSKKVTVDNNADNDSDVDNDADVNVVLDDTPQTYVTVSRHDTG